MSERQRRPLYLIRLGFVPLLVIGTELRVVAAGGQEGEEEEKEVDSQAQGGRKTPEMSDE